MRRCEENGESAAKSGELSGNGRALANPQPLFGTIRLITRGGSVEWEWEVRSMRPDGSDTRAIARGRAHSMPVAKNKAHIAIETALGEEFRFVWSELGERNEARASGSAAFDEQRWDKTETVNGRTFRVACADCAEQRAKLERGEPDFSPWHVTKVGHRAHCTCDGCH